MEQSCWLRKKENLRKNNTWEFVNKQKAQRQDIVTSRGIFKKKEVGNYKARQVLAKGCQVKKFSYDIEEIYNFVVYNFFMRTLPVITAHKNWNVIIFYVYIILSEWKTER